MVNTQPNVDPKGKYTPKQAAEALGISISTLNSLFKSKVLKKHYRAGNRWPYVTGKDILEFW